MVELVSRRVTCRLCAGDKLALVLPMRSSPIADAFVDAAKRNDPQPLFPLDLYQCQSCGHAQNLDIVNPDLLFRDYIFTTSSSGGLVEHFRRYADDMIGEFKPAKGALVLEIGSNDGTLLRFFKDRGFRVLGIDPATGIANRATEAGVPTQPDYFSADLATMLRKDHGPAKLVVANNVYAHTDQLADVTMGIVAMLDDDGVFVFEVSYLLDIIDKFLFDTIYHEHLSYHSVEPLARFLSLHGLHLFDAQRIASKGGSLRGFAQKKGGPHKERPTVQAMIREEQRRGLHSPGIFREFEQQILARKSSVLEFVDSARGLGKSIVGYGASTTSTTLMYHFELFDKLEYLIDDNPKKHGLYSPGCHLEVKSSAALYELRPDVAVILAWQYAETIIAKHGRFVEGGGQFVLPLVGLRVVEKASKPLP